MELNYKFGSRITKEIKGGKRIHEELEEEVNIPIVMQPKSYSDALYETLYKSYTSLLALTAKGKCREVQMYGSINGYKLVGRIDQLEREGGKVVISEDKTKANGKLPSNAQVLTNRVQLMLYRKMLDDLIGKQYDAKNFARAYSIDRLKLTDEFLRQLKALDIGQELMNLYSVSEAFFEMFPKLGKVNDSMKLVYRDQATGDKINIYSFDYNEEEARDIVTYVLKFWNGERKSKPVPENEKWKCSFCRFFGKECTVWWPQRELDA